MFRIGEFSKLTQVTIRMLRYYDEMGLLKPSQIDPRTNYRMYSVDQIPTLNKIIYLRDSGFNVAEIAIALNNGEDNFIAEQLDKKHEEIEQAIQIEKEKLRKCYSHLLCGGRIMERVILFCSAKSCNRIKRHIFHLPRRRV